MYKHYKRFIMWYRPKDQNYYNRLAFVNKVKKLVESKLDFFQIINITPTIPYSYNNGKISIESIQRYKYDSQFKRTFTTIRLMLSDGTYVKLQDLRTKHLIPLYQFLCKEI